MKPQLAGLIVRMPERQTLAGHNGPRMQPGVVIVGGGQAGLEAAAALRTQGYEGTHYADRCEEPRAFNGLRYRKTFSPASRNLDSVFLPTLVYYEKHCVDLCLGDPGDPKLTAAAALSGRRRDGWLRAVGSGRWRAQSGLWRLPAWSIRYFCGLSVKP